MRADWMDSSRSSAIRNLKITTNASSVSLEDATVIAEHCVIACSCLPRSCRHDYQWWTDICLFFGTCQPGLHEMRTDGASNDRPCHVGRVAPRMSHVHDEKWFTLLPFNDMLAAFSVYVWTLFVTSCPKQVTNGSRMPSTSWSEIQPTSGSLALGNYRIILIHWDYYVQSSRNPMAHYESFLSGSGRPTHWPFDAADILTQFKNYRENINGLMVRTDCC
jgi:hypothetical protein